MVRRKYTDEQREYIKSICKGRKYSEIAELINVKYDLNMTAATVRSYLCRYGLKTGIKCRFEKGHVPFNKGMKCPWLRNNSIFTKGHVPFNTKPLGTERINKDGYIEMKVDNPNRWQTKHSYLWKQYNGRKVPDNHIVIFANKNTRDFSKENLLLVSRAELMSMNQNNLIKNNTKLTELGLLIAKMKIRISELKKGSV